MKKLIILLFATMLLVSCTENYSNGERIGFVNKFSEKGLFFKSWEGELNLTQTGMNSSSLFNFSIDNDNQDELVVKTLDSAAVNGWKVKSKYHEMYKEYLYIDILCRKSKNGSFNIPFYSQDRI